MTHKCASREAIFSIVAGYFSIRIILAGFLEKVLLVLVTEEGVTAAVGPAIADVDHFLRETEIPGHF